MMIFKSQITMLEQLLREAREECVALRKELKTERERNRKREEDLIDRILTRNNSRPITPEEEPAKPVQRPLSKLEIDRLQDMMKEELEYRNLNPEAITPDVRSQLDDMLEDMIKAQRPFQ